MRAAVTRFSRRTAILCLLLSVLIIVMVAGGTVLSAVGQVSTHANRLDDERSRQTTEGALKTFVSQLGATLNDYAAWDDATANAYDPNGMAWMISNFGDMTVNSALFDVAIVMDTRKKVLMAYQNGAPQTVPAGEFFDSSVWTLFDTATSPANAAAPEARGIVRTRSGIAAVGIALIRNKDGSLEQPADKRLFLLFARHIDDKIADLSQTYVVNGLHLVGAAERPANFVPVVDPSGTVLAKLTWPSRAPGDISYRQVSARLMAGIALFGFLLAAVFAIGLIEIMRLRSDEEAARQLSLTDRLSGLLNRAGLFRALGELIEDAKDSKSDVALLYLDLDGFKEVNDAYGHGCGDDLIRSVSAGFRCLIPKDAILARVGGDEFAIAFVMKNCEPAARQLADVILAFFDEPFEIGERIVTVGTSIGMASSQIGTVNSEELVRRADIAMYKAKETGRGRAYFYDGSMDNDREMILALEADLRIAIDKGDLTVAFQPVIDSATLRITSVETLVRWTRPGRGPVSPEAFIPVAEKTGLIEPLGLFVLEQACARAKEWTELSIAVNISPVQLRNPTFAPQVAAILEHAGVEPSRLILELTEGYLIQNPQRAQQSIERLKALGVKIALDDFGSGFSSIGYLRQFGFDRLKIDRSMVADIDASEDARSILQATAALARSLDLPITAEGVEREEQALILKLCGCDELQGYLYGKPMAAEAFTGILANERRFAEGVLLHQKTG